ncbi:helix-turn-helix domain-containing protein [Vibrio cionasavignyae]|uniref:helix-turn-helix domain-containing protein n=1 Tax=Vibrio cionasavignyae TaxID=2910252 RepID=UPI003D15263E
MNMYERISKRNNYNNSVLADIINSSELGRHIKHIQFDFDNRNIPNLPKKSKHNNHIEYNDSKNPNSHQPNVGNYTIYSSTPLSSEEKNKVNKKIKSLAEQYFVQSKYNDNFKHPPSLIGVSHISQNIHELIIKSSTSDAPVFIHGATGTEKLSVASNIHFSSKRQHLPFIEVNCLTIKDKFDDEISYLARTVKDGTIYLSEIDYLTPSQQNKLLSLLLQQTNGIWKDTRLSHNIRIISSSSTALIDLIQTSDFNPFLAKRLDFLTIDLPRLNERREDIPTIIQSILLNGSLTDGKNVTITPCGMSYLRSFDWEGDNDQLHKSIIKIVTFRKSNTIDIEDIKAVLKRTETYHFSNQTIINKCSIIHYIFNKEFDRFKHLHPSVQNAILYLSDNFNSDITLHELASHSYVSASHLSYLLRDSLNRTFKQILIELRIESAKKLFSDNPQLNVTQVCLDSGFNDLSNFEKTFKKYTLLTPRQYRKECREKTNYKLRMVI